MKTEEISEKDTVRDQAWKELVQALHAPRLFVTPKVNSVETRKLPARKSAVYHPALITGLDFNKWDIFG